MNRSQPIATLLVLAIFQVQLFSQEAIEGIITDWSLGSGEVVTGLMEPIVVGSVDQGGNFSIPLNLDFMETIEKQVKAQDSRPSGGWTSSLMTLAQVFSCYEDSLHVVNGDQPVTRMTTMGVFNLVNLEAKKRLGYLLAASSEPFAAGIMEMGAFNFQKGYILDWIFVNEAGSVNGSCSTDSYAVNQEEKFSRQVSYNLSLKPGWNLIKYEISKLFTDREGKTYPMDESYSSLSRTPEDFMFVFVPE